MPECTQHQSRLIRSRARARLLLMSALLTTAVLTTPATAHPFHVSLAEAEWNPKSRNLEVALKVHATDLEKAIRRHTGKPLDLDKSPDVDRWITAYLKHVLRIKSPQGTAIPIKWVGKEVTLKAAWLYFEVPLPTGIEGVRFSNQLFFELLSNQVNTINFKQGKRKLTLRFTRQSATHIAKFPASSKTTGGAAANAPDRKARRTNSTQRVQFPNDI